MRFLPASRQGETLCIDLYSEEVAVNEVRLEQTKEFYLGGEKIQGFAGKILIGCLLGRQRGHFLQEKIDLCSDTKLYRVIRRKLE